MNTATQTISTASQRLDVSRALATPIKELGDSERPLYLAHLLALHDQDRYLRFGSPLSNGSIESYVGQINFGTDTIFGVFDDTLSLAAAGHFAPIVALADEGEPLRRSAEFGLSVDADARGRGLGTALFLRSAAHARNMGIGTLFMHCLSENRAMMRIARKAGMEIQQTHGEADAYLTLQPGDIASAIEEGVQRQIALFDFAVKRQLLIARKAYKSPASMSEL